MFPLVQRFGRAKLCFPSVPPLSVMRQRQEKEGGDALQSTNSQLLGQAKRG